MLKRGTIHNVTLVRNVYMDINSLKLKSIKHHVFTLVFKLYNDVLLLFVGLTYHSKIFCLYVNIWNELQNVYFYFVGDLILFKFDYYYLCFIHRHTKDHTMKDIEQHHLVHTIFFRFNMACSLTPSLLRKRHNMKVSYWWLLFYFFVML